MTARPSVRRRSLIWTTLLLTLLGLVAAGIAYSIDLAEADRLLDAQIRQIALYAGPDGLKRSSSGPTEDPNRDLLVEIRDGAGAMLWSSDPGLSLPRQSRAGFSDVTAAGESWRSYLSVRADGTVQVSQRTRLRRHLARTAALEAAIPILISIPLGWLAVGWGSGQIKSALSRLAGAIAARGVESRTPLGLDDVPAEFRPLVEAMNALIARWQRSLEQQKRFLSDAAHELRTPLTALGLQIDLLRSGRDQEAGTRETALLDLARGADRATSLVDQLLRMARYETDDRPGDPEAIDIVPLVVGCMAEIVVVAESRAIDLGLVGSEPARLGGNGRDLRLLVSNLIENAVRYTPSGGIVDVGVRIESGRAIVEVADSGPGIAEALLPRVFDRFFRAPGLVSEGSGLGLAIALAIARRHGLELTLRNRPEGGLVATVSGPALAEGVTSTAGTA